MTPSGDAFALPARVLVTGASGFVGRHVVPRLRARGVEVLALARGPAPGCGPSVLAGPAELQGLADWPGWPPGLDAVLHLAALNPARGEPGWGDEAALMRANAAGTAALAARAAREGVPRLVMLSTARVHAGEGEAGVSERSPLRPADPYARSKAAGEAALRDAVSGSATLGVVLRPVPVFGPGGRGLVASLGRLARTPLPLPLSGLGGPRSLVAVDSLAAAIEAALAAPRERIEAIDRQAAPAFLVADRGPLDPAGIVAALRAGMGRRPGVFAAPFALPRLARALAARTGAAGLAEPFVVDTARAEAVLGWRPADSAADALRAMAAAAR